MKYIPFPFIHAHKSNLPYKKFLLRIILLFCIWILAIYVMYAVFSATAEPIFQQELIYSDSGEITPSLYPGECFSQTFQLKANYLDSMAVAFSYDESAGNSGSVVVQFYLADTLIVEQPLPLFACPVNTFLAFHLDLDDCIGKELTIQITNTSEDAAGVFSLMCTTNLYDYRNHSEGYVLNGSARTNGSCLCLFRYKTGYDYYKSLAYVLWIFLVAIALSGLILTGYTSLQQRNCH